MDSSFRLFFGSFGPLGLHVGFLMRRLHMVVHASHRRSHEINTDRPKSGAKHSPPAFPNFSEGLPEGNFEVPDRRGSDFVTVRGQLICFQNQVSEALGS